MVLILWLILCSTAFGQNSNKALLVDELGKAILRTFATCEYKLILKEPKNKEVKITVTQIGNGYFVGEHNGSDHNIFTANHLIKCDSTISELEKSGVLGELDRNREEDLRSENLVGLKDEKLSKISAYTHEGVAVYDIRVWYNLPDAKDDADWASLKGTLGDDVFHNHFPLMDDKVFDEIFYKDGVKKRVETWGFLLLDNDWYFRYKDAEIESVLQNIFRINELLDQGLSGSPIAYFHEGTFYAIGVLASAPHQKPGRVLDMSWVTIIKKSFLEKRNKK